MHRTELNKNTYPPETGKGYTDSCGKTLEGDDVVIVIWECCVNVGAVEAEAVHPRLPSRAGTSSSGIAVSVPKSKSWTPGPPSRAGTCPQ